MMTNEPPKYAAQSDVKHYKFEQHPEYPAVRRIIKANPYTYTVKATHD